MVATQPPGCSIHVFVIWLNPGSCEKVEPSRDTTEVNYLPRCGGWLSSRTLQHLCNNIINQLHSTRMIKSLFGSLSSGMNHHGI